MWRGLHTGCLWSWSVVAAASTQLQLVGVGDLYFQLTAGAVKGWKCKCDRRRAKRKTGQAPRCSRSPPAASTPTDAARNATAPPKCSPSRARLCERRTSRRVRLLSLSLSLRRRRLFASARCGALPAAVVGGCAPHYSHGVSSNEYHPVADTAASSTHAPAYLRESATATKEGERTNGGEREKEGARRKGVSGPAALAARTRRAGLTRKQRARAAAGVGACAPCRATLSAAPTLLAPLSRRGAPRAAARRALTTHR